MVCPHATLKGLQDVEDKIWMLAITIVVADICPCITHFSYILLLDLRMDNYKIYNPVFITCMFWFIRLIYYHCLYASARLGGVMLRTAVSSSKHTYLKKLNRQCFP